MMKKIWIKYEEKKGSSRIVDSKKSWLLFRYGEYRQSIVNLVVHMKPKTTTTSSPSSSAAAATGNPTASALTPNSFANNPRASDTAGKGSANNNSSQSNNTTTVNPMSAEEEYERQKIWNNKLPQIEFQFHTTFEMALIWDTQSLLSDPRSPCLGKNYYGHKMQALRWA